MVNFESSNSQALKELRERNNERLHDAKEKLGVKYLLHPSNMVQKKIGVEQPEICKTLQNVKKD